MKYRRLVIVSISVVVLVLAATLSILLVKRHRVKEEQLKLISEGKAVLDTSKTKNGGKVWSSRAQAILMLAEKEPKWDELLIPEELKLEYKVKYPQGLFTGDDYDYYELENKIDWSRYDSYNQTYYIFYTYKGKRKNSYYVRSENPEAFCKITSIEKIQFSDDEGNDPRPLQVLNKENWLRIIGWMSIHGDSDGVAKTERFNNDHPNFTGFLNPYGLYDIEDPVEIINEKCDYEKKEVYIKCYNISLAEDYEYKITYETDENLWLDSYNVEVVNKSERYSKNDDFTNVYNSRLRLRLIYKDRDWSKLPITSNFKNKFHNDRGVFKDFDVIYYTGINLYKSMGDKTALHLYLSDGSEKYVGLTYVIVDNKIDDILIKYLPDQDYANMTREEIYNMF